MTLAWYGHLHISKTGWLKDNAVWKIILVSWAWAFVEYCFAVPANRVGSAEQGGPFSLFQLKMLQEVITLLVFTLMAVYFFKADKLGWNHLGAFVLLLGAVYLVFKK